MDVALRATTSNKVILRISFKVSASISCDDV